MSTPKAVLYKGKTLKDGTHPIRIRVYFGRERYVSIGVSCKKEQWSEKGRRLNSKMPNRELLNQFIRQKEVLAEKILKELALQNKPFSFENFKQKFKRENAKVSFDEFLDFICPKLSYGNAQKYIQLGRVVKAFLKTKNRTGTLRFEDMDKVFLKEFEYYLTSVRMVRGKKLKKRTVRFYFSTLAACFNKAIEWDAIQSELYPFKNVWNPKGFSYAKYKDRRPNPKPISIPTLNQIKNFPVDQHPELLEALYFFIFSYLAHGMSFCDMAMLKKDQINGERIYYTRQKTHNEVPSIKINKKMREIIDYFDTEGDYVFPILKPAYKTEKEIYWGIVNARRRFCEQLAKIGNVIGAEIKLTSYVARYTFANVVIQHGADIRELKEMMGHSSIDTTLRYVQAVESTRRDELQGCL